MGCFYSNMGGRSTKGHMPMKIYEHPWWVITGIYVGPSADRRSFAGVPQISGNAEILLADTDKDALCPDVYPSENEADNAAQHYQESEFWESVKVVEVRFYPR